MVYRRAVCPHRSWFAVSAATFATIASAARFAPSAWATDPPSAEYKTLAAALADAKPPAGDGVALTVDAENIKPLPANVGEDDARPLTSGAPVIRIAARFGRLTRHFGTVTALAPPTMVLIDTPPAMPNIYEGMPQEDVLTLLLASLNPGQWQAITSEQGLQVSAMATSDQKMLMAALLPKGKLNVAPYFYQYNPGYKPEDVRDLSTDLPQGRLRLNSTFGVLFPTRDNANQRYSNNDIPPPPGGPAHYKLANREAYIGYQDRVYGATVRETVPNREKNGQLPYEDGRLNAVMPLTGVKTVYGLIRQVAKASGMEIYADPRYAGYRVTWIGGRTASVRSVLRALAFCCTAVYRRVGPAAEPHPAYVLTDDITGMGTRKALWYEFERDGDALRAGPVAQARQSLYTRFGPGTVRSFGDAAELASPPTPPTSGTSTADSDNVARKDINTSYDKLTTAQQAAVDRAVEEFNKAFTSTHAVAEGKITMYPEVKLEMLLPSLETPLDMNLTISTNVMFAVPKDVDDRARAARAKRQMDAYLAAHPDAKTTLNPPPPSAVAEMLAKNPRRAVIVSPESVAEITDDIAAMQTLNLNELWLDLPFQRRMDNSDSKAGDDKAASPEAVPTPDDLLAAALHGTEKTGIRVYPVFDVFAETPAITNTASPSGADSADKNSDRNILGETSREAEKHVQDRQALVPIYTNIIDFSNNEAARPLPPVALSPFADGALTDTQALIRRLAAQPSIAGFVWKDTDPPGYDAIRSGEDLNRRLLGYGDAMRLAFLRKFSADPVDLYGPNSYTGKANTSVGVEIWTNTTGEFNQKWKAFRRTQNIDFLRQLATAAGSLPIVIHQRREGPRIGYFDGSTGHQPGWYGSWDGADAPLPTFQSPGDDEDRGQNTPNAPEASPADPDIQARKQSLSVLTVLSVSGFLYMRHYNLPQPVGVAKPAVRPNDGFVLDFAQPNHANSFGPPARIPQTLAELAAGQP